MITRTQPREDPTSHRRTRAFCLSVHAPYQCRHAGACCTSGWHIPAEATVVAAVTRRFGPTVRAASFHIDAANTGEPAMVASQANGACVFFEAATGRTCRIHRELGEPALPSACRHFPRVTLTDPNGAWISLSHFCPTAAGLLFDAAPLQIVEAPDRLSLSGTVEGLDATGALPPLLRPGMLMDFEGYEAWVRMAIELLDQRGPDVDAALAALAALATAISSWSPGGPPLRDRIAAEAACVTYADAGFDAAAAAQQDAMARASVPVGLTAPAGVAGTDLDQPDVRRVWRELDAVIRRYLASKCFGAWWPYLGLDLVGIVRAIHLHAAVLRTELARRIAEPRPHRAILADAIRASDLLLVHLSDCRALARRLAQQP